MGTRKTIKFRAWDKEIHTWLMPSSKTARNISIFDSYGVLSLVDEDDKLVWCQFIGLHDKNGKEIWEGDILRVGQIGQEIKSSDPLIEVMWDNEDATFRERKGSGSAISYFNKRSIVVANIFQNPELLKEQNHE